MDPTAASWADLTTSAPDIAAAGRRLLEDEPGMPGVAFLGTVGADGVPRIHPFIPAVVSDDLWAFVIESPKQRDLDRAETFAIHSRLGADDESFFCGGRVDRLDAPDRRSEIAAAMSYSDIDARHLLYRFALTKALWTTWSTPTSPVHRSWKNR